jgi:hypothetical protein
VVVRRLLSALKREKFDIARSLSFFVICGLRERAERIGAQLEFWSEVGAGTEVQLAVPAPLAYETSSESVGSKFIRKVRKLG